MRHQTGDRRPQTKTALVVVSCLMSPVSCLTAEAFPKPKDHPVTAELITEHASVQPGGTTRVGVHFDLEEGWHIYAKNPGDAGIPTSVAWTGPNSVSFGPLQYPKPQEFLDPGDIHTFGYTGAVVLSSTLTAASSASEALPIHAEVKWLACKEICVPGSTSLDLTLPVSNTPPTSSAHAELFEHTD